MRHRMKTKKLGRKSAHRKAVLKNMARAILIKESIKTTKVKARVAQPFIDRIIAVAKKNTPERKRHIFALIRDKALIPILFDEIAPRFKSRTSGFTRIIPVYHRKGDGAAMAILELVEKKAETKPGKPEKAVKKDRLEASGIPQKKALKAETKEDTGLRAEEKRGHKAAPEPKIDLREKIKKEKAIEEEKKIKKGGLFKKLRRYFRGKSS